MGMIINRRRVCGGKSLPYDAEIEYLKTAGNGDCYIIIYFQSNVNYKEQVTYKAEYNNYTWKYDQIFGRYSPTVFNSWSRGTENIIINFGGYENTITSKACGEGTITTFIAKYPNVKIIGNGLETEHVCSKGSNVNSQYFSIFSPMSDRKGIISIYSVKLWNDSDVLVFDFIPVRVGNVGYMYDKVSGQLFGNAGTGEFILGPDKQ